MNHQEHYDPAAANRGYNTVLPLDVLRALSELGEMGPCAPRNMRIQGLSAGRGRVAQVPVRVIAKGLQDGGVNAAWLAPV